MRYCTKCGKEVGEHWKFCLSCGAELPDDAAAEPGREIPAPPVRRPPEPGVFEPDLPGKPDLARDAQGTPAARPGAKPAVLLSLLAAVALVAGLAFVLTRGGDRQGDGSAASGPPEPAAPPPGPVPAPVPEPASPESVGAFERTRAEAERQLRQAEEDLRREVRELRVSLAAADAEADGSAEPPAQPDSSLLRDRIKEILDALGACTAGPRVTVRAKVAFEGATGRVAEATAAAVGGDLSDEARSCIVGLLRGMTVPPFTDPTFTVEFVVPVGGP